MYAYIPSKWLCMKIQKIEGILPFGPAPSVTLPCHALSLSKAYMTGKAPSFPLTILPACKESEKAPARKPDSCTNAGSDDVALPGIHLSTDKTNLERNLGLLIMAPLSFLACGMP